MHISLDLFNRFPGYSYNEGSLDNLGQNPIYWYTHKSSDPDFISVDRNDKVTIVKPLITLKYEFQSYLYIFKPYDPSDKTSPIYKILRKFRKITETKGVSYENNSWIIFLTDEKLSNYDENDECPLDKNGEIIENDELEGSIAFTRL